MTRGPVPTRSDDLARPRERKGKDSRPVTKGQLRPVTIPRADSEWHPIAKKLWDGMKRSGQADYFQDSDWALLYSVCDDLSVYKESKRRSPEMAKAIYSVLGTLLVSEGDRRRARIELSPPKDEEMPASVTAIADARARLGVT